MADKIVTLTNSDDDSLYPMTQHNCVTDSNGYTLPSDFSQIIKQGDTLTKPLTVTGGDTANSGKIIMTTDAHITDTGNKTLFGRSAGGELLVGSNDYRTKIRGSRTRLEYKDKDLAFTTDPAPAITYSTTAPSSANTSGLKVVVLSSEPATRYSGYIYIITESNS